MKVYLPKGIAYTVKNGEKVAVDWIEVPTSDCCKLDCCNNVLQMKDKDSGEEMVGYFFDGDWVVTTKEAFLTDKANGDFNY